MISLVKLAVFINVFFAIGVARADIVWPQTIIINNKGNGFLKEKLPFNAQEKFIQALEVDPFSAEVHMNLGSSFFAQGQMDKARSEFELALKFADHGQNPENIRFAGHHNLGVVAHLEKKTDVALDFYRKALDFNPASKETKINIELLIQEQQKQGSGGENKEEKDKKDQSQDDKNQNDQKDQDSKDQKQDQDKDNKNYAKNKPQPPKFNSQELTEGDVKKILGELRQQEQKIRAEFNKKDSKEKPNEKDW